MREVMAMDRLISLRNLFVESRKMLKIVNLAQYKPNADNKSIAADSGMTGLPDAIVKILALLLLLS